MKKYLLSLTFFLSAGFAAGENTSKNLALSEEIYSKAYSNFRLADTSPNRLNLLNEALNECQNYSNYHDPKRSRKFMAGFCLYKSTLKLGINDLEQFVLQNDAFFKTQLGVGLLLGWTINQYKQADIPYYIGSFFGFDKYFHKLVHHTNLDNSAKSFLGDRLHKGLQAFDSSQKSRFEFYFEHMIPIGYVIECVRKDFPDFKADSHPKLPRDVHNCHRSIDSGLIFKIAKTTAHKLVAIEIIDESKNTKPTEEDDSGLSNTKPSPETHGKHTTAALPGGLNVEIPSGLVKQEFKGEGSPERKFLRTPKKNETVSPLDAQSPNAFSRDTSPAKRSSPGKIPRIIIIELNDDTAYKLVDGTTDDFSDAQIRGLIAYLDKPNHFNEANEKSFPKNEPEKMSLTLLKLAPKYKAQLQTKGIPTTFDPKIKTKSLLWSPVIHKDKLQAAENLRLALLEILRSKTENTNDEKIDDTWREINSQGAASPLSPEQQRDIYQQAEHLLEEVKTDLTKELNRMEESDPKENAGEKED